ncbi:MAG TPA: hypothetical protein VF168_00720 [Trueperaceae bacterium]
MKSIKRTVTWLLVTALLGFGIAVAQDQEQPAQEQPAQEQPAQEQPAQQPDQEQPAQEPAQEQPAEEPVEEAAGGGAAEQPETRTIEIQGEEVAPLGEIQVAESQPYEEAQAQTIEVEVLTGAISLDIATPDDQSANVDIVGPNGYYQRVEVDAADDEPTVVDGLLPGVYSIAATDDNLQVAHTLVEVKSGEIVGVQATLEELAAFDEGAFEPAEANAYPDNAFQAQEEATIEDAEFGEVTVQTENEDTRFVVTGPNNYSQEFTGTFTASDLAPGVYVIAGTLETGYEVEGALTGAQIATSAVEVNVSQAVTFVPVYDVVGAETQEVDAEVEEVEDVAGGGEAQEQPAEEQPAEEEAPAEEEPAVEQPAEEQPAEEQPAEEEAPAEEQAPADEPANGQQ